VLYLTYRPANGFKRVMAYVIDMIPIHLAVYVVIVKVLGLNPLLPELHTAEQAAKAWEIRGAILACSFVVWVIYCAISELSPWRGTYGKLAMGIRVRGLDRDNHRLNLKQVTIRNTAKFLSAAPCFLGFIWAFFTNGNRAWHDSLSETAVAER
jgi:uncharacterized RDD family membrane protein YckC